MKKRNGHRRDGHKLMKGSRKRKKSDVLDFIRNEGATLTRAASMCGISRQTVYNWMRRDEVFKQQVEAVIGGSKRQSKKPPQPIRTESVEILEDGTEVRPGNADQRPWKEKFIDKYIGCRGVFEDVAEAIGIKAEQAYAAVTEGSASYDPEFVERLERLRPAINKALEDSIRKNALRNTASSSSDAKFLLQYQDASFAQKGKVKDDKDSIGRDDIAEVAEILSKFFGQQGEGVSLGDLNDSEGDSSPERPVESSGVDDTDGGSSDEAEDSPAVSDGGGGSLGPDEIRALDEACSQC